MKKFLFAFSALLIVHLANAQTYELSAPNGRLVAKIESADSLTFALSFDSKPVIEKAEIGMDLGKGTLPAGKVKKATGPNERTESRDLIVPNKDRSVSYTFNELVLSYKGIEVQFRMYDVGFSYRFVTTSGGKEVKVMSEQFDIRFPENSWSYFPPEKSLYSHYEQQYHFQPLDSVVVGDFCALPVRMDVPGDVGVLITEADHFDYPGLFLSKKSNYGFESKFPHYILKSSMLESRPDRYEVIEEEAEYIAKTTGKRSYPWRVFMVSDDDRDFVENDLVMALSRPSQIQNTDWIKPGKIAWDWYNANNVYGVDFESGINNDTYKYYIDFASKFGLEYVILDEGWTRTTTDVMASTEVIDVPELVAYAKERNVSLILWLLWHPLDKKMDEILKLYNSWGVKGIKVDFMQRADQYMVKSYEEIAKTAAKYELLVDFHGAFKPAGLRSAYPNVMTYEGVMGNENNKWGELITPEHNVTLPFTRMVAGPMDYTPGAMANAQKLNFNISFYRPMSQGTRCHQAAMYVVYESPLQMLCDAPSAYLKDEPTTKFISEIPAVWDETRVLHGKIADYIVVARRSGDKWYIGGMTDWTPRSLEIDLSFLGEGTYSMKVMKDGINASKFAEDYQIETKEVNRDSKVKLNMAPGGGWTAVLSLK